MQLLNEIKVDSITTITGVTIVDILKNKTQVYICFDNDENQAGQKGTLAVGQALFDAGIKVKAIDLPRGSEKKIDVAEFMKGKQAKDFEILKDKALRFIPYALSTCNQSESKVENLETAEEFVRERLLNIDELYRNGYISDDVKRFFGFVGMVKKQLQVFTLGMTL